MEPNLLSGDERAILLVLARRSIEAAAQHKKLPAPDLNTLPPALRELGASFVTLTEGGDLRGCIGTLEARQALALDVIEHAAAASQEDFRFRPVMPGEVARLRIEISRLTPMQRLEYARPDDLPGLLRPHVDGVVLRDSYRRATFLPQVWEKLPDPREFLMHLCAKMGAPATLWQRKLLEVYTYQVEEFQED